MVRDIVPQPNSIVIARFTHASAKRSHEHEFISQAVSVCVPVYGSSGGQHHDPQQPLISRPAIASLGAPDTTGGKTEAEKLSPPGPPPPPAPLAPPVGARSRSRSPAGGRGPPAEPPPEPELKPMPPNAALGPSPSPPLSPPQAKKRQKVTDEETIEMPAGKLSSDPDLADEPVLPVQEEEEEEDDEDNKYY